MNDTSLGAWPFPTPVPQVETKPCAYSGCTNHRRGSTTYCCAGCRWDHEDSNKSRTKVGRVLKTVHVPVGAEAVLTAGEEPIVISIEDKYLDMSEIWFLRHYNGGWGFSYADRQSWLVLLNGAYMSTDYDERERYAYVGFDQGDYRIVDQTILPVKYSDTQYLTIAKAPDKKTAELLVKALNAYQPKPQRRRKNG